MTSQDSQRAALWLGKSLIGITGVFVGICGLTQGVGENLGALVFLATSVIWPAQAIVRGENWGRIAYLVSGPFALWACLYAQGDAEFLHLPLFILTLAMAVIYLIAVFVLMHARTREWFNLRGHGGPSGSCRKGFSVFVIGLSGFLFGWWWSNFSTAFHLLSVADFQGVMVCAVGTLVAIAVGALGARLWGAESWPKVWSLILLSTGLVLFEHALCYTAITGLVYIGGDASASESTALVIAGRYFFATAAIAAGMVLRRLMKRYDTGSRT